MNTTPPTVPPATAALTERDAAFYCGISPHTLKRYRVSGARLGRTAPPFLKLGKSVRYLVADLDQWLRSCRVTRGTGG